MGVSAEKARGAVEGLAAARRTNPGLNGILANLGIDPRQTDNAKVLIELLAKLRNMPYYQGAQLAGMFGVDEQTFQMLEQGLPEMQKYLALREKMFAAAGVNPQEMAARSHELMGHLRIFEAALGNLADIIAFRLMPAGEKVLDWLTQIVGWFTKADKATDGWSSKILGLGIALKGTLSAFSLGSRLLGRGAAAGEGTAAAGVPLAGIAALAATGYVATSRNASDKIAKMFGLDPKGHQISDAITSLFQKAKTGVSNNFASMVAGFEGHARNGSKPCRLSHSASFWTCLRKAYQSSSGTCSERGIDHGE